MCLPLYFFRNYVLRHLNYLLTAYKSEYKINQLDLWQFLR